MKLPNDATRLTLQLCPKKISDGVIKLELSEEGRSVKIYKYRDSGFLPGDTRCGGLESGAVAMITGPSGAGKTTLGLQFIKDSSGRGEASAVYKFKEDADTLMNPYFARRYPTRKK